MPKAPRRSSLSFLLSAEREQPDARGMAPAGLAASLAQVRFLSAQHGLQRDLALPRRIRASRRRTTGRPWGRRHRTAHRMPSAAGRGCRRRLAGALRFLRSPWRAHRFPLEVSGRAEPIEGRTWAHVWRASRSLAPTAFPYADFGGLYRNCFRPANLMCKQGVVDHGSWTGNRGTGTSGYRDYGPGATWSARNGRPGDRGELPTRLFHGDKDPPGNPELEAGSPRSLRSRCHMLAYLPRVRELRGVGGQPSNEDGSLRRFMAQTGGRPAAPLHPRSRASGPPRVRSPPRR